MTTTTQQEQQWPSLYNKLSTENKKWISKLNDSYSLTHQEKVFMVEACRDLVMWQEKPLQEYWEIEEESLSKSIQTKQAKKKIIQNLSKTIIKLKSNAKSYKNNNFERDQPNLKYTKDESDKAIIGKCPVWSDDTVCCQLKVLDVVQNCAFACSYCTIQTFYGDKVVFDANLKEKLEKIDLNEHEFHHIGSGQSSDALVWGNRNNILDDLCGFASARKNILLEFKTKSNNISYLLKRSDLPKNIVCSWSLNPQTIIDNEEHSTASLNQRLDAARAVADHGVKVAFHFHPMVYYDNWETDYKDIVNRILSDFDPNEVLFISFGSITFIKPVIKKIRERDMGSRILQMEFEKAPKGKLTYPEQVKLDMFHSMNNNFSSWNGKVFFYLCMEKKLFWDEVFGFHYPKNQDFADAFEKSISTKIRVVKK
jgi:spore photoproduct lyase